MKNKQIIEFIRYPEKIDPNVLQDLHDLVERYPYFQSIRILYLKALYLSGNSDFSKELKRSTVHITDHKQFFKYLNAQIDFPPLPTEETTAQQTPATVSPVFSIDVDLNEEETKLPEETELTALETKASAETKNESETIQTPYRKKDELIDRFILSEPVMPKITASSSEIRDLSQDNPYPQEELFSETLAKIYLKQHLYEKAIATYIKLSLKYPEKSIYFADRIEKIKENINKKE